MASGRRFRWAGWPMALLLAVLLAACGGEESPAGEAVSPRQVTAEVVTVTLREVPRLTRATGTVEPWLRVSPGTKILGRIEAVPIREGEPVGAGQVLAELESRDLEANLSQARAAVSMAEAQLENAAAQHERMKALHERGSVTDKNLEDAVAGIRVARAGLEQAEANVAAAEVMLEYATVRAPVTGWVVRKMAEAGDMASPGMPLFVIDDLSRVKVNVSVPEADAVGIDRGDPVGVTLDALDTTIAAEVERLVPSADPASRTFDVKVLIDNPDGRIKSGMFVRVAFDRGTREVLLVPESALVRRGQLEGLFVLDEGDTARLRWVKTGSRLESGVEILSGLEPGERVVASPPAGLRDGNVVREG